LQHDLLQREQVRIRRTHSNGLPNFKNLIQARIICGPVGQTC
jgi:hypothetical protein